MTEYHPLDNPAWEALNGRQAEFAIKSEGVLRYRPDVFMFAGIPDASTEAIKKISKLYQKGEVMGIMGFKPDTEPYFKHVGGAQVEDTPEIAELVELTRPGPYAPNVLELGRYVGIKEDGKLIAMAGERIKLDGYTEVSLVCTHPDYRGKGYAKSLSGVIIENIMDSGDVPFLNVMTQNIAALKLYEKLGFTTRVEYMISAHMRL